MFLKEIPFERWIFITFVIGMIIFVVCVMTGVLTFENTDKLEAQEYYQEYGVHNIITPIYFYDPRTKLCFAMLTTQDGLATVECTSNIKKLMFNPDYRK